MATQTSLDTVQKAYIAFYGRPADYAGLQYWAGVLDQTGGDLGAIINAFGNSAESNSLYGNSTAQNKITMIYQQLFNRAPDIPGLNYWAGEVNSGNVTLQGAALAILNGAANSDATLIAQKLSAAEQFTNNLHSTNTDQLYDSTAITAARGLLGTITTTSTASDIATAVNTGLSSIYKGMEYTYNSTSYNDTHVALGQDATYLGTYQSVIHSNTNYQSSYDVFIDKLGGDMKPVKEIEFGSNSLGNETLTSMVALSSGNVLAYGNFNYHDVYISTFDSNLNLQKAITIGDLSANASTYVTINGVKELSNGNILVYGKENVVADGDDAYALVLDKNLNVVSERRFDNTTSTGSNESFVSATELSNGQIALLGNNGELVITDASLTVTKKGTTNLYSSAVASLDNGLLGVWSGNDLYIYDSSLTPLSTVTTNLYYNSPKALGNNHFVSISDSSQVFFTLNIDATGKNPTITIDKQLAIETRSGSTTSSVVDTAVKGSTVDLTQGYSSSTNLFVYQDNQGTNPNLANDYRLYELHNSYTTTTYNKTTDSYFPKIGALSWDNGNSVSIVGTSTAFYANTTDPTGTDVFTLTNHTSI